MLSSIMLIVIMLGLSDVFGSMLSIVMLKFVIMPSVIILSVVFPLSTQKHLKGGTLD
jgi:hypothetical protein